MSCAKTELCIFDGPSPQVVVDSSCFEEIFPVNSITGSKDTDIQFNILASNTDYLDLNDTLLYVQVKVEIDGKNMEPGADVTPTNYMFHTLFEDVILTLNNEKIEGGNKHYTHKALFDTILNLNADTKNTNLDSIGYNKDDSVRSKWISESKKFAMCGALQLDFFDQPKYLIPGVNVLLRLMRNKNSLSLISTKSKPKLYFTDARLYVRRVKVEPSVLMGHQIGLNTQNAIYPIRKTSFVRTTLPSGISNYYKEQIFPDSRLPKFIVVAFQSSSQYSGAYTESVATFKNMDVRSLSLMRSTDFRETYNQDFSNNYVTTYAQSIIRNMGFLDKNLNNGITLEDFKNLYPFFTFVLAPDFDIHQTQVPKQGNLRLDIKFNSPLTEPGELLIYGVFDGEIQINKSRMVIHG
jgi:hypothetical protein